MDFAFSTDQDDLRIAARELLEHLCPVTDIAAAADAGRGFPPSWYAALAEQGWPGLSIPELLGGLGQSRLDEAVLFEEAGRALLPGPFTTTVALGLPVLLAAAESGPATGLVADLLPLVAAGERTLTLAWAESRHDDITVTDLSTAVVAGRLVGVKRYVPDLVSVTDVLVTVAGDDGLAVHLVSVGDLGVAVLPRSTSDTTRPLGELLLEGADPAPLLRGVDARIALGLARRRWLAAAACEAVGVGQACLDLALAHASTRQQFGRVIGTYQAVSHQIADSYSDLQLARSAAYWAAWSDATNDPGAEIAACSAMAVAGPAAVRIAERAIQVHGGMGMTWEHPLHRYYKRALGLVSLTGGTAVLREQVAAVLLG